ncbi:hypothetical protein [Micromonospora sp. NPDC049679]|uniref:hypothetical protein n=1 Tax=Micromonospora sp. NPDC049679 TaxID=3155920 RepID=UPI0033CF4F46
MESLRDFAGRLDDAAATLTVTVYAIADLGPPASAFGADAPGSFGELGRALHAQWVAAVGARGREAAATAERCVDAAGAVRVAADAYAETDDAARRRLPEEA